MLGSFIQSYQEGKVSELKSYECLHTLPPGTPVVMINEPECIKDGHVGSQISFAILSDTPNSLIMQEVVTDEGTDVIFQINEVEVLPQSHYFTFPTGDFSPDIVLQRAQAQLGRRYDNELRSYPGDDFVQECLHGLSIQAIYAQRIEEIGQHWWTPLEVTPKNLLDDLQEVIRRKLADIPEKETIWQATSRKAAYKKLESVVDYINNVTPEMLLKISLPQLEHHAILIEGAQCIIFSGGAIRHITKKEFCNTSPNTPIGGPAKGSPQGKEDIGKRLLTRNMSVWQLCRAGQGRSEWKDFNLILNNSEHFCRYCRTGEATCTQLRDKTIVATKEILNILLPGWLSMVIDLTLAQLDLTPGTHATIN